MKIKSFKKMLFITILLITPVNILAIEYPDIYSENAILYDITDDKILYDVDADEKISIASLTKIMTTIVAIENIENLNEVVTITDKILSTVRWDASKAGLKVGDKVTYLDLLYASILPSGADATNSLAILTSGSIEKFVGKMNAMAKNLNLSNTHYVNVTGLDAEGHYSTASDVLELLKYCLKNELFKEIFTTKTYTLSNGLKVESTVNKYNRTLGMDTSKIIGSKTGFTKDAGLCISAYFKVLDHEMILITLKAPTDKNYNLIDSLNLIEFVGNNYSYQRILEKEDLITSIQVENSKIDTYDIRINDDVSLFLENDYDKEKIKVEYNGLEYLSFFNKKNETIGTVNIYYDNELVSKQSVILDTDIEINVTEIIFNNIHYVAFFIAFIICFVFFINRKKNV